ncbi:MAG: HAD-IA family hydrolase [Acholeplasmataceae bacterium]|nr:HAD-IA family hydrolase [Acholeplasmataceae bacterium]
MIKAVIFDMDGTILNTIEDIWVAVNHALKIKGQKEKSMDDIKLAVGNGAIKLIDRVAPPTYDDVERKELFHLYQNYYDQHNQIHTGPYEGIIPLLKKLKDRKIKLGVVSNKFEHLVQKLNEDVFLNLFDVAIGEMKGIPIKPAPDMLYQALNHLHVMRDETLFVGDSEVDIDTAKNAKITSIGVTWGFRDKQLLIDHGAHYIIDHPDELLAIITKENTA